MEQLAKKLRTVYKGIYRYVIVSGNPTYMEAWKYREPRTRGSDNIFLMERGFASEDIGV